MSSLFLKITEQKGGWSGTHSRRVNLETRGFFNKRYTLQWGSGAVPSQAGEWNRSLRIKWLRRSPNFTWMEVSHCQFHRGVLWAKNIFICVSGLWPAWPMWKKRSRPPLRSPILLCTRVTCQLMWPSWDVNRSGKNQMFSFTSGASTLFFSRRWQANMSRYWPGTLGLWERSRTRSLGSENIKI